MNVQSNFFIKIILLFIDKTFLGQFDFYELTVMMTLRIISHAKLSLAGEKNNPSLFLLGITNKEITMNKKRLPFDIEKAKAGWPVVNGTGQEVRIVCYDRHHTTYPIIALFYNEETEQEEYDEYTKEGYFSFRSNDNDYEGDKYDDLFLAPKTKTLWINIYSDGGGGYYNSVIFESEEEGAALQGTNPNYVGTYPIEIDYV